MLPTPLFPEAGSSAPFFRSWRTFDRLSGLCGNTAALEDAAGCTSGRRISQENRSGEEEQRTYPGHLGQKISRSTGTEDRRARAAKHRSYISPFSLLQQNHDYHRDTYDN